ncbi:Autoinducer 2 sensor kinase/phosphatase LuxQ [Shimia sp. SK013]|uniref:ATP-binding protein n=1 Tax=Shimia sp. SK013 TaxID=1389006 RepID=UPI0006B5FDCC|nr:ATP-binding protein [Shimia sp. SK013]KPA20745.1 Autoinducer 2 sensor kinase/phosphatase LuxQ [Shimia sp. SK013]
MRPQNTSDGAPRSIQDAIAATRRDKEQLDIYVTDRVKRTRVRMLLYVFGCVVAYGSIGFQLSLAAFALLVSSDLLDVFLLRRYASPLSLAGQVRKAQKIALIGGIAQGVGFAFAPAFYFFTIENPDIVFVVGCIGLGAVNAAMVLPQNLTVGATRLTIHGATPAVMLLVERILSGTWELDTLANPATVMLLGCMIYMLYTFSKAGMVNHSVNRALFRSREDLKLANARMARQQAEMGRLSQVTQKANDTVIITNTDREIVWVNEAFERSTGYTSKEAIGQNVAALLTQSKPELLADDSIDRAVKQGTLFRGEVQSLRKDGSQFWVDVNLFPIRDEDGAIEFIVTIERDVTEARKIARERDEARALAEAGAKAKAEFLANMSHEIRTPLSGVMGMADLLAETELDDEQRRFADTIRGSSMSLMAIINDILDLSKLDAGRMELHAVAFSPEACFRETVDLLTPMARAKDLTLDLSISPDLPGRVWGDDGRIRQVATNIIGNAIKFTETGGVSLRLFADADGCMCFDVRDSGIGIAQDKLDRIFDHFTQAEASTTRRFGGSGLGLSISRHIVQAMGGEVVVTSELGMGSTFSVRVPVEAIEQTADELALQAQPVEREGQITLDSGLSILIVEDNKTNRFLLSRYLKDQPVEVEYAVDGLDGLEKATRGGFDLVFMDMSMPRMGGIEATQEIRKLTMVQPRIVALTAHAFDDERQACLQAGMDDFLTKPIRKSEFLSWIATFQSAKASRSDAA